MLKIGKEVINKLKTEVLPVNLFSGRTNGNITLSDSIMNYDFIEVIYSGNNNYQQAQSIKLDTRYIQSSNIELQVYETSSTHFIIRSGTYSFNGNQINRIAYRYITITGTEFNNNVAGPYLYILSVNGIKVLK